MKTQILNLQLETIREFQKVNDYLNIVKTIGNKKGILYLDDAEFFELIK